ncbi:MAG TPA: hypothetical protein VMR62_28295 [Bryobacteraceae bacterium]|jgi:hypothetical protein|nr:hypothetical protein [Bryobacteraceae bacterium]
MAALMFVLRCWGPANYGIFVTATTGMVVLLIAMVRAGYRYRRRDRAGGALAVAHLGTHQPATGDGANAGCLSRVFHAIQESYTDLHASMEDALDRTRLACRRKCWPAGASPATWN